MHDRKLLSDDSELDGAEPSGQALLAMQPHEHAKRTGFWAIIGFCVTGLVGSLYLPPSYFVLEQMAALLS
jgi:hypothetical protein